MDISVIIPAFNEENRITKTLEEAYTYLSSRQFKFEIIVVNDGSVDGTVNVIISFAKSHPGVRLISLTKNQGKGAAVREGILASNAELVLFTDADGSTSIKELERLEAALKNSAADVAVGSRALKSEETSIRARIFRKILGRVFNLAVNILAVPKIKDTQCGFKLFKKEVAKKLFYEQRFPRFSFDLEVLWKANRLGYKVVEVPVNWTHVSGSKVNVFKDGIRMLLDAFKLSISKYP
jgi:dolichyl-phosphate beta-glucosyltransferase